MAAWTPTREQTNKAMNVMVTCGGKWVGLILQLKKAMREVAPLENASLLVADQRSLTPAGHFADASVVVPPIGQREYVDALVHVCRRHNVGIVIPLIDLDLLRLAPHRGRFAAIGTRLATASPDLVELCFDKAGFEAFAVSEGIRVPRSFPAHSLDRATFPLFYKPPRGFGSQGCGVCRSLADARDVLSSSPDAIFQEYVDAPEISVDAYIAQDGNCTVRVQRIRDKVVGGEAVQTHTVKMPAVRKLAARTIDALTRRGLRGPLNVQLFASDDPAVIEVNPRLGSAVVLSNVAAGGRLLRSLLAESCGLSVDGDPDDYESDLHLYRYLGDVIHNGNGRCEAFPERFLHATNTAGHGLAAACSGLI